MVTQALLLAVLPVLAACTALLPKATDIVRNPLGPLQSWGDYLRPR